MKLLLDEQISGKVAERLRDRGHDVTAATDDPSLRGLKDPELFEVAQEEGRVLVTYNRVDFEPIIREYARMDREHHGEGMPDQAEIRISASTPRQSPNVPRISRFGGDERRRAQSRLPCGIRCSHRRRAA